MNRSLLVLSAPEKQGYYSSVYKKVIDFHIRYAKAIMSGSDNVLILTDKDSYPIYERELGSDVLVPNSIQRDIWMRDFTTVNPHNPVQFKYAPAAQGGDAKAAKFVQSSFNSSILSNVLPADNTWNLQKSTLVLDGGNFVDNHSNRVIVTEKILEDSGTKDREWVKRQIMTLIPTITEVAIIPYDDPNLGHADGMVMWVDDATLFVNEMSDSPKLRDAVWSELRASFPTVNIVEVPCGWVEGTPDYDEKFSSALGININTVMTGNFLYVPVFGNDTDGRFLDILSKHTTKTILPIEAASVAPMGGSCRCLTWQLSGNFARDVHGFLKPVIQSIPLAVSTTYPVGAVLDIKTKFKEKDIKDKILRNANINYCSFKNCRLENCTIKDSEFKGQNLLTGCSIREAEFRGPNTLDNCSVVEAIFKGGHTLSNCQVKEVEFKDSNQLHQCNVTSVALKGSCTLVNCSASEIEVHGHVQLQAGGKFEECEVRRGGIITNDGSVAVKNID
eukprot:TRINITY_DN4889_c0_g1_i1.p1 TRINITY_DN4889_c0_g1~~TRINITY_DN4889_c0_g1_i1.p1  ORF type:complete len:521 (+),score=109.59 TRINITY_DN4889_c0_g1_i1:56-1564(+)